MEKKISTSIVEFIEAKLGTYDFDFNSSTSLENDLGITGDEGKEFIEEYSELFNVDISKFKFSDYFYPEPSFLVDYGTVKPFTLGDLELGITNGFLF